MKRISFSPILFITLVSVLLFTITAQSATLEVGPGKTYTKIQPAINAAGTGDTILVYDGTYIENIDFLGKAITVKSVGGASNTIIDGNASGTVITFDQGEGAGSVLEGLTLKNGNAFYGGGGVHCKFSSSPTITNCIISGNTATYGGGGIYCDSFSSPTITNCIISENTATNFSGGGIYCYSYSSPTITNCIISGNTTFNGGGIYCYDASSFTITNCTITGNTAKYAGGGIYFGKSYSPTITNCTISGNTTNYNGGGIYCYSSSPTLTNSILWGDTATTSGNEIYLDQSIITVTYSDVEDGWTGTGNINADPLFVGNSDYHLKAGSPCIDTGTSGGAPAYDIDGDPRPQGAGYDIGSDEYAAASTTCSVWGDVISKYNFYVGGQAQWNDVIGCYNQYVSH